MSKIYLDHHTATRPCPSSIEAMLPFLHHHWGSTLSPHNMELLEPLERFSEAILETLGGACGDRFYFFSSGAEAIHHVYFSHYLNTVRSTGKNHILTTNTEEAAILTSLKRLEELGCHGKILPVDTQGRCTAAIIEEAIGSRTSLVSIGWANPLTGVIHPIADIAEVCRAKGVLLHVDVSYVVGKLYARFEDFPIDFLTFDGAMLHSPRGTAGLLVKKAVGVAAPPSSLVGAQLGGLAALAEALNKNNEGLDEMCLEVARLRDKLERGILQLIADAHVFFQNVERLPNCTAIAFPNVFNEALLFLLHRKGIHASLGGGHCQKLSHLLLASGVSQALTLSALSFSLSLETKEKEIDDAVCIIADSVQKLKRLSENLL